jgi:hypothetical protein
MTSVKALAGIALTAIALLLPATARADSHMSIAINAGTPGLGASLGLTLGKSIGLRVENQSLDAASGSFGTFGNSVSSGYNAYATHLTVHSTSLFVDIHPAGGAFMITIGAMQPTISLDAALVAAANQIVLVGGVPIQFGGGASLAGSLKWNRTAPYLGIGYLPMKPHGGLALGLEAGAAYIGPPAATLVPIGSFSVNGAPLDNAVEQEQASLQQSTKNLDFYPVATASLNYTF